ncbi:MAG: hypothetical protein MR936_05200 [Eubacterium sp.]|nr:hypothetical protein [Eubacterium sp.]
MMEQRNEARVYDIINRKAGSNIFMQGLTGWMGFPFTLFADAAVFFTHYGPMLNDICAVYGRKPVSSEYITPIIKGCKDEVISDIIIDKVIGNIPIIGLPANMIAAKAMTWRLGILFGMLAARGEEINQQNVENAIVLIRNIFPQRDSYFYRKPSVENVEKLIRSVEGDTFDTFDLKVSRILDAVVENAQTD